jgi:hypothetical protein
VLWRTGEHTAERASKGAIARQIVTLIAQQIDSAS